MDSLPCHDTETDPEWLVLPLQLKPADGMCTKLNSLVEQGVIPSDGYFYKHINDVVGSLTDTSHVYDREVIEFYNTIQYLGGSRTANFIRGPMYTGQGRKGKYNPVDAKGNLYGPSSQTCLKHQAGYTTTSGVIRDLLLVFLTLAQQANVPPILETGHVHVIPCVVQNDGTALKAGLQFDERRKNVVGLTERIDLRFVKNNPKPDTEFLKSHIVTEAVVSYISSMDNGISLPISVDYVGKKGKTGEHMQEKFKKEVETLQTCEQCLKRVRVTEHTVDMADLLCRTACKECWAQKEVCAQCTEKGQTSYHPSLRFCSQCHKNGTKCIKVSVLVYTADCEEGNKKAFENIQTSVEDGSIEPSISMLTGLPDAVHVGKSLKCGFHNWYIILGNSRLCLSVIRTLRENGDPEIKSTMRKLIKNVETVRNKDRMAVDPILDLSNPSLLKVLQDVGPVVHTLAPELARFTTDNKVGMYPHPVDICVGQNGLLYALDYAPMKKESKLLQLQLHNPVRVKVLKENLPDARSVCYTSSAAFVCTSNGILYHATRPVELKIKTLNKQRTMEELRKRNVNFSEATLLSALRTKLGQSLQKTQKKYQAQGTLKCYVHVDTADHPNVICRVGKETNSLICFYDNSQVIRELELDRDGVGMVMVQHPRLSRHTHMVVSLPTVP